MIFVCFQSFEQCHVLFKNKPKLILASQLFQGKRKSTKKGNCDALLGSFPECQTAYLSSLNKSMIQNVWLIIPEECSHSRLPEGRRRCVRSVPMKAPDFPKQTSNISPEHLNAAVAPFPKPSPHPIPSLLLGGREEGGFNLVLARWSSGHSWMGHHCALCSPAPASNIPGWTLSN